MTLKYVLMFAVIMSLVIMPVLGSTVQYAYGYQNGVGNNQVIINYNNGISGYQYNYNLQNGNNFNYIKINTRVLPFTSYGFVK